MMTVSEVLTAIFVGFQVARFFFLVSRFASRHLVVSLVVSRVWCGVLSPLVSVSRPSLAARAIVRQPQSSVPTSFLSSPASPRSTSGTTLTTRTARTNRKRRLCAVRRSLFTVQVRLRKDLSLYNTNYKQETKDLAEEKCLPLGGLSCSTCSTCSVDPRDGEPQPFGVDGGQVRNEEVSQSVTCRTVYRFHDICRVFLYVSGMEGYKSLKRHKIARNYSELHEE